MSDKREIPLRIRVIGAPSGVAFCLQRGKGELVPPTSRTESEIVFDLSVRVGERPDGAGPNLLGPYAQGPRDSRFVYVNSGTSAGQMGSCWTRRAKVSLMGITHAMVDEVERDSGVVLEVRFAGTGRGGGPSCATVPLLDGGWRVVPFPSC